MSDLFLFCYFIKALIEMTDLLENFFNIFFLYHSQEVKEVVKIILFTYQLSL